MSNCINDPCEAEATTEREGVPYCYTCASAYDAGYEDGYKDGADSGEE